MNIYAIYSNTDSTLEGLRARLATDAVTRSGLGSIDELHLVDKLTDKELTAVQLSDAQALAYLGTELAEWVQLVELLAKVMNETGEYRPELLKANHHSLTTALRKFRVELPVFRGRMMESSGLPRVTIGRVLCILLATLGQASDAYQSGLDLNSPSEPEPEPESEQEVAEQKAWYESL